MKGERRRGRFQAESNVKRAHALFISHKLYKGMLLMSTRFATKPSAFQTALGNVRPSSQAAAGARTPPCQ